MKKKPLLSGKRYLNNAQDSISIRIKSITKTFFNVLSQKLSRKKRQNLSEIKKQWMVKPIITQKSSEPKITWIGHATFLIQIGGINILTDPAFFEVSRFAASRIIPAALPIEELPNIDVIMVSHNHRDHLDSTTIKKIKQLGHNPVVLAPLGTKAWFAKHGLNNIHEKTWWDEDTAKDVEFTFLPASHWSGRNILDTNKTLWGSWIIKHNDFTIYFAGDSAYDDHFSLIHKAFPKIDVAIMPIAPNDPHPLIKVSHIDAQESLQAFRELGAQHFIAMHWGTFSLEHCPFDEPIEIITKLWKENKEQLVGKKLHILKFGQSYTFES